MQEKEKHKIGIMYYLLPAAFFASAAFAETAVRLDREYPGKIKECVQELFTKAKNLDEVIQSIPSSIVRLEEYIKNNYNINLDSNGRTETR